MAGEELLDTRDWRPTSDLTVTSTFEAHKLMPREQVERTAEALGREIAAAGTPETRDL